MNPLQVIAYLGCRAQPPRVNLASGDICYNSAVRVPELINVPPPSEPSVLIEVDAKKLLHRVPLVQTLESSDRETERVLDLPLDVVGQVEGTCDSVHIVHLEEISDLRDAHPVLGRDGPYFHSLLDKIVIERGLLDATPLPRVSLRVLPEHEASGCCPVGGDHYLGLLYVVVVYSFGQPCESRPEILRRLARVKEQLERRESSVALDHEAFIPLLDDNHPLDRIVALLADVTSDTINIVAFDKGGYEFRLRRVLARLVQTGILRVTQQAVDVVLPFCPIVYDHGTGSDSRAA